MKSTNNLFDVVVDTQSKIVENLVDTAKKISENVSKLNLVEKATETYKDLVNKQKSMVDALSTSAKGSIPYQYMPDFMKDLIENQIKMGEDLVKSLRDMGKDYTVEKAINTYQDQSNKLFTNWKDAHVKLFDRLGKPFNEMQYNPVEIAHEVNEKLIEATRAYVKMFDVKASAAETTAETVATQAESDGQAKKATATKKAAK